MLLRLFGAGVAWLAAILLFAALLQWSGSRPLDLPPGGVSALARSLNSSRPANGGKHTWTVMRAIAAHRALVVEVDALYPNEARAITEHVVEAVGEEYDEVLVYVHALDSTRDPLIRRVTWTPRQGYLASAF